MTLKTVAKRQIYCIQWCDWYLVGIRWLKLTVLRNGLIFDRFSTFFLPMALTIFRGYRSIPATTDHEHNNKKRKEQNSVKIMVVTKSPFIHDNDSLAIHDIHISNIPFRYDEHRCCLCMYYLFETNLLRVQSVCHHFHRLMLLLLLLCGRRTGLLT